MASSFTDMESFVTTSSSRSPPPASPPASRPSSRFLPISDTSTSPTSPAPPSPAASSVTPPPGPSTTAAAASCGDDPDIAARMLAIEVQRVRRLRAELSHARREMRELRRFLGSGRVSVVEDEHAGEAAWSKEALWAVVKERRAKARRRRGVVG